MIDLRACLHDFWNVSAFVNIFSETSLEKLSQLNGLLNNGNREGKPTSWKKNFYSGQSEARNSTSSGIGLVRVSA